MSSKRILIPAAALALGLTLAACSGNDSSSSPKESKVARPAASALPSTKPTVKPTEAPKSDVAIVLGGCNSMQRTLTFINPGSNDPERGSTISTRYITLASGQSSLFSCTGDHPGSLERSAFNKDYSKLGIVQSGEDNESRIGYVTPSLTQDDPSTSTMQDLSGTQPDDGGFGAKRQRSNPAFDPTTGNMVFLEKGDTDKLLSVNPDSGDTAKPTEVPGAQDLVSMDPTGQLFFFPHSGKAQGNDTNLAVYSSDGKNGFAIGKPLSNTIVYGDLDSGRTRTADLPSEGRDYIGLEPVAYLSKDSFLAITSVDRNKLYRVTVTGSSMKYEPVLADTDGAIYDVTLSPDGKAFAFMLEKLDTTMLFTAKTDGTSQTPKPLRTLDVGTGSTYTTAKILGWEAITQ